MSIKHIVLSLYFRLSTALRICTGKDERIKKDVKAHLRRFGDDCAAYCIDTERLNAKLNSPNTRSGGGIVVYSFGVGEDATFERDIIEALGADVYAFDPTPKAMAYVERCMSAVGGFHFYPYGIDTKDGYTSFFLPQNESYVSGSVINNPNLKPDGIQVEVHTLEYLMQMLGHSHIDVLKMDIEGSEFAVMEDILSRDIDIEQICVEIHQRFFADGKDKLQKLLDSLHKKGYKCAYVSESNVELTFVR